MHDSGVMREKKLLVYPIAGIKGLKVKMKKVKHKVTKRGVTKEVERKEFEYSFPIAEDLAEFTAIVRGQVPQINNNDVSSKHQMLESLKNDVGALTSLQVVNVVPGAVVRVRFGNLWWLQMGLGPSGKKPGEMVFLELEEGTDVPSCTVDAIKAGIEKEEILFHTAVPKSNQSNDNVVTVPSDDEI